MAMYPNMMQSIPFKKHKKNFQAGNQEKQNAPNEKGEEKENEQKIEENNATAFIHQLFQCFIRHRKSSFGTVRIERECRCLPAGPGRPSGPDARHLEAFGRHPLGQPSGQVRPQVQPRQRIDAHHRR